MAKRKIFVSYDYDNDSNYKNLLLAWDKNREFEFGFSDISADVSIQSTDATVIKRGISTKINAATYFLCLVGTKTSKSGWVAWEIDKAKELRKKLVAVKLSATNPSPLGLIGVGASWAMSVTLDGIKGALDKAG